MDVPEIKLPLVVRSLLESVISSNRVLTNMWDKFSPQFLGGLSNITNKIDSLEKKFNDEIERQKVLENKSDKEWDESSDNLERELKSICSRLSNIEDHYKRKEHRIVETNELEEKAHFTFHKEDLYNKIGSETDCAFCKECDDCDCENIDLHNKIVALGCDKEAVRNSRKSIDEIKKNILVWSTAGDYCDDCDDCPKCECEDIDDHNRIKNEKKTNKLEEKLLCLTCDKIEVPINEEPCSDCIRNGNHLTHWMPAATDSSENSEPSS